MTMKAYSTFRKLERYWSLTVRLFNVISGHSLWVLSFFVVMQLVYSTAPANWAIGHSFWGLSSLQRCCRSVLQPQPTRRTNSKTTNLTKQPTNQAQSVPLSEWTWYFALVINQTYSSTLNTVASKRAELFLRIYLVIGKRTERLSIIFLSNNENVT